MLSAVCACMSGFLHVTEMSHYGARMVVCLTDRQSGIRKAKTLAWLKRMNSLTEGQQSSSQCK